MRTCSAEVCGVFWGRMHDWVRPVLYPMRGRMEQACLEQRWPAKLS